jgi:outer membrane protein assembly factor BamB
VVAAQDELRAYDPSTGKPLWQSAGMAGWVAPSPVSGMGLVFAVSGKDGPAMAVKPGGRVVWHEKRGGPYVCSPILVDGRLYVHDESGILTCRSALDGKEIYRERLKGRFSASAVAADGKIYFTNEEGTTSVVKSGPAFELLAENRLGAEAYASPAVSRGALFIRTGKGLWCLRSAPEE